MLPWDSHLIRVLAFPPPFRRFLIPVRFRFQMASLRFFRVSGNILTAIPMDGILRSSMRLRMTLPPRSVMWATSVANCGTTSI